MRNRFLFIFISLFFLISCEKTVQKNDSPKFIASVNPLGLILHDLTGEVPSTLIGKNEDPHNFELKSEGRAKLQQSNFILFNGLQIEPFGEGLKKEYGNKLLIISEELEILSGDPNLWLDPLIIKQILPIITERICKDVYNNHCSTLNSNFEAMNKQLIRFIEESTNRAKSFSNKKMLVSHDVWGRFAERYRFEKIGGLQECETLSLKSNDLEKVISLIKKEHLKYIFVEPIVEDDKLDQFIKDLKLQPVELDSEGIKSKSYMEFITSTFNTVDKFMH